MRFHRVATFSELPQPACRLDPNDDAVIAESDLGFDLLSRRLSDLYLVDAGDGQQGAVISMYRYVAPCRHHTIVVDRPAWNPDILTVMQEVLGELPEGWSFGIDATELSLGQASIVVARSGDVFGWSDFRARGTLEKFGFKPCGNPISLSLFFIRSTLEKWRRTRRVRRILNKSKDR